MLARTFLVRHLWVLMTPPSTPVRAPASALAGALAAVGLAVVGWGGWGDRWRLVRGPDFVFEDFVLG